MTDRRSPLPGRLTWVVLALALVVTLGGLHPSDLTRDVVLAVTAALVVLLNLPGLLAGLRARAGRAPLLVHTAARLVAAAFVLLFTRGISHETVDWEAKDAWRRCRATEVRWPDDPAQRCQALSMCLNEAPGDNELFLKMIAATPDCPPP